MIASNNPIYLFVIVSITYLLFSEGEKVKARVIYRDYFTGQCVCSLLKARVENPEIDGYKIGKFLKQYYI